MTRDYMSKMPDFLLEQNSIFRYESIVKVAGFREYFSDFLFNRYREEPKRSLIIDFIEIVLDQEKATRNYQVIWFYVGFEIMPAGDVTIETIFKDLLAKLKERDCSKPWPCRGPTRRDYIREPWIDARTGDIMPERRNAKRSAYRKPKRPQ